MIDGKIVDNQPSLLSSIWFTVWINHKSNLTIKSIKNYAWLLTNPNGLWRDLKMKNNANKINSLWKKIILYLLKKCFFLHSLKCSFLVSRFINLLIFFQKTLLWKHFLYFLTQLQFFFLNKKIFLFFPENSSEKFFSDTFQKFLSSRFRMTADKPLK